MISLDFFEVVSKVRILLLDGMLQSFDLGSFTLTTMFNLYLGLQVSERGVRVLDFHLLVVTIAAVIFLEFSEFISQVEIYLFLDCCVDSGIVLNCGINCALFWLFSQF